MSNDILDSLSGMGIGVDLTPSLASMIGLEGPLASELSDFLEPSPILDIIADERRRRLARMQALNEQLAAQRQQQAMAEEGLESLSQLALRTGMSSLGYLANAIDKPGRGVRVLLSRLTKGDVLGGLGGLLNWIPFSDTLGITDFNEDNISGRDLARQWGLANPNKDTWGNFAGGIVTEVLLDPLTYMTAGLGKAGQVAAQQLGKQGVKALTKQVAIRSGREMFEHAVSPLLTRLPKLTPLAEYAAKGFGRSPMRRTSEMLVTPRHLRQTIESIEEPVRKLAETLYIAKRQPEITENLLRDLAKKTDIEQSAVGEIINSITKQVGDERLAEIIAKAKGPEDLYFSYDWDKIFSQIPEELMDQPLRTHIFMKSRLANPVRRLLGLAPEVTQAPPWKILASGVLDRTLGEAWRSLPFAVVDSLFRAGTLGATSPEVRMSGDLSLLYQNVRETHVKKAVEDFHRRLKEMGYEAPATLKPVSYGTDIASGEADDVARVIVNRMMAEGVDPTILKDALRQNVVISELVNQFKGKTGKDFWEQVVASLPLKSPSKNQLSAAKELVRQAVSELQGRTGRPNVNKLIKDIVAGASSEDEIVEKLNTLSDAIAKTSAAKTLADAAQIDPNIIGDAFFAEVSKRFASASQTVEAAWKKLQNTPSLQLLQRASTLYDPKMAAEFANVRKDVLDRLLLDEALRGLRPSALTDEFIEYWPRLLAGTVRKIMGGGITSQPLAGTTGASIMRKRSISNIPGGTGMLQAIILDPTTQAHLASRNIDLLRQHLGETYGAILGRKRLDQLTKLLIDQTELSRRSGLFPTDPTIDLLHRLSSWTQTSSASDTLAEILMHPGVIRTSLPGVIPLRLPKQGGEEAIFSITSDLPSIADIKLKPEDAPVSLRTLLRRLSFRSGSTSPMVARLLREPTFKQLYDSALEAAKRELSTTDLTREQTREVLKQVLDNLYINQETARSLLRKTSLPRRSEGLETLANWYGTTTDLFKTYATILRPQFHVGNLLSGQLQSLMQSGADSAMQSIRGLLKGQGPLMTGLRTLGGVLGGITPKLSKDKALVENLRRWVELSANPTDEEVWLALHQLANQYGVKAPAWGIVERMGTTVKDVYAPTLESVLRDEAPEIYGSLKDMLRGRWAQVKEIPGGLKPTWKLWAIANVGGLPEHRFIPARIGEVMSRAVENANRMVPFVNLIRKGYSPMAAAERVGLEQVRYAPRYYTPFERGLAKWLIPFYKFNKGMASFVVDELTHRPAGPLAQTLRLYRNMYNNQSFIPNYLRDTLSIYLGTDEQGNEHYLANLGLMPETAFQFLALTPDLPANIASTANPLIRGFIEWLTQRSLWQMDRGEPRRLNDLDPLLGRLLTNIRALVTGTRPGQYVEPVRIPGLIGRAGYFPEVLVTSSPAAPWLSLIRTFTDSRKSWPTRAAQLLTRMRSVTIPTSVRDSMIRDELERIMLEQLPGQEFSKVYVPQEVAAYLSPREQQLARDLEALYGILSERAQSNKIVPLSMPIEAWLRNSMRLNPSLSRGLTPEARYQYEFQRATSPSKTYRQRLMRMLMQ